MPIYEYRCDRCGNDFEELVFSETRVACPRCRTVAVTRKLSIPAPPVGARTDPPCESGLRASGCCGGGACHQH